MRTLLIKEVVEDILDTIDFQAMTEEEPYYEDWVNISHN